MKRYKNLYDGLCSFENLLLAAHKARRGKRYLSAPAAFCHRIESELLLLQDELRSQTYQPGPFKTFVIHDPKARRISAAPFRDRVVHHALCNVVEPIWEHRFIFDSYACRAGKGTHAAVDRLTRFMQGADYALKCDIRKYFPSIDHALLKQTVHRKIGCPRTLWLIDMLIDGSEEHEEAIDYFAGDTDLFAPLARRRGLPIGNQTSQFFANVYLDPLDHFIKETLGCRRYLRYVDDFVVLADDKQTLWSIKARIEDFLAERLRLRLHPRKQFVSPVTSGVDFLGYRVFPSHRLLRRANGVRFARRLRAMQALYQANEIDGLSVRQRIGSWIGHAAHGDTFGLRWSLLKDAVFSRA